MGKNVNQIRNKLNLLETTLKETRGSMDKIHDKYGTRDMDELKNKFYNLQSQCNEVEAIIREKESQCKSYKGVDYKNLLFKAEEMIGQLLLKHGCETKDELKDKIELFHKTNNRRLKLEEIIKHRAITSDKLMKTIDQTNTRMIEYMDKFYDKTLVYIEDNINFLKERINIYDKELMSVEKAIEVLEKSFYRFHMSFSANLNEKSKLILKQITGKNYNQVLVSKDFDVKIADGDKNEVRSVDYFSNGTWDQIYFSIRMGIYEILRDKINKSLPLLLDDAFVQYDEERMKYVLDYIVEYAKENQVVLFTCQKREIEYLHQKKNIKINILDIA